MSDEFFPRDNRQPRHFWADNEVFDIYGPKLGAHGFAVYMALAKHAMNNSGECRTSISKIARQLDMSKGGVFNALNLILQLGLAQKIDAGDNRHCAAYVLADVKALVDPNYAQLRLAVSVHTVNAKAGERSSLEPSVHTVNARVHPMNAAFTPRTRNKEDKTSLQDVQNDLQGGVPKSAAPPAQFLQSDFDERDLRKIGAAKKKLNEWIASHPSSAGNMSNSEYYRRIAEEAGVTIKRIFRLEEMQCAWPEAKGEPA
jgi:hypothetical protein